MNFRIVRRDTGMELRDWLPGREELIPGKASPKNYDPKKTLYVIGSDGSVGVKHVDYDEVQWLLQEDWTIEFLPTTTPRDIRDPEENPYWQRLKEGRPKPAKRLSAGGRMEKEELVRQFDSRVVGYWARVHNLTYGEICKFPIAGDMDDEAFGAGWLEADAELRQERYEAMLQSLTEATAPPRCQAGPPDAPCHGEAMWRVTAQNIGPFLCCDSCRMTVKYRISVATESNPLGFEALNRRKQ